MDLQGLRCLKFVNNLKTLDLSNLSRKKGDFMFTLYKEKEIRKLCIGEGLTNDIISLQIILKHYRTINSLTITHLIESKIIQIMSLIATQPHIVKLQISVPKETIFKQLLLGIGSKIRLTKLSLRETDLTQNNLEGLLNFCIEKQQNLGSLEIKGRLQKHTTIKMSLIKNILNIHPNLESVKLTQSTFNNYELRELFNLRKLCLTLSKEHQLSELIKALEKASVPNLEKISLNGQSRVHIKENLSPFFFKLKLVYFEIYSFITSLSQMNLAFSQIGRQGTISRISLKNCLFEDSTYKKSEYLNRQLKSIKLTNARCMTYDFLFILLKNHPNLSLLDLSKIYLFAPSNRHQAKVVVDELSSFLIQHQSLRYLYLTGEEYKYFLPGLKLTKFEKELVIDSCKDLQAILDMIELSANPYIKRIYMRKCLNIELLDFIGKEFSNTQFIYPSEIELNSFNYELLLLLLISRTYRTSILPGFDNHYYKYYERIEILQDINLGVIKFEENIHWKFRDLIKDCRESKWAPLKNLIYAVRYECNQSELFAALLGISSNINSVRFSTISNTPPQSITHHIQFNTSLIKLYLRLKEYSDECFEHLALFLNNNQYLKVLRILGSLRKVKFHGIQHFAQALTNGVLGLQVINFNKIEYEEREVLSLVAILQDKDAFEKEKYFNRKQTAHY